MNEHEKQVWNSASYFETASQIHKKFTNNVDDFKSQVQVLEILVYVKRVRSMKL